MKGRRYDIDWLRVIAMLGVFVLHCTRFFCTEDWQLKVAASEQSEIVGIVRDFTLAVWLMPLFFLVAGFAARYSLRRRTAGQYLVERVKRILIPLYTVGMFVLVVPQDYFQAFTDGRTTETFWQWLPSYYLGLPARVFSFTAKDYRDPVNLVPYTFSGHLWFLQLLFVILLVTLPLFLYLKSERGQRLTERLAQWSARPGGIFLFVIPIAIFQIGLGWLPKTTDRTWADFFWYACFFVIGYIIATDDRFTQSIKRHGWICLVLWIVVCVGAGGLFTFVLDVDISGDQGFSALFAAVQIVFSLVTFSAVIFLMSLGAKYLSFTNRFLTYGNEAVLPFFLFHQTIIQIVGWFVLPMDMGNLAKFLIIAVVSFPLILILYELLVRHIGFMRFLFGMAPKKKHPTAVKEDTTWKSKQQSLPQ
jgi:glucan biosynthesis protein C